MKPSVVSSAVRAPRSSSSAFVATVMPWAKLATSRGPMPARSSTSATAAITPSDWSAGVVGTFPVKTPAGEASTASVNVPPTSTPSDQRVGAELAASRHGAANLALSAAGRAPEHQGRVRFRCSEGRGR